jgi:SAM-dependent methyltransferase
VADADWLAAAWPFVQANLRPPPGRVVEIGCGRLGGFVPRLRALGYDATGVDPEAPVGAEYERIEFEQLDLREPLAAAVACTSLHHVADLDVVLERVARVLEPGGTIVVIEWASERFDEATARWCFDRLSAGEEHGWLREHRNRWQASGQTWSAYFQSWLDAEALHRGTAIMAALRSRFQSRVELSGPYLFGDLDGVSPADEQGAIDAGDIQANGLYFVGQQRA